MVGRASLQRRLLRDLEPTVANELGLMNRRSRRKEPQRLLRCVRYRYRCRGISVPETPGPQPPAATNREISARERNRSLSGLRQSLLRAERAEQLRRYCGLPMLRLPRQTFRWPTASWQKPRPDG